MNTIEVEAGNSSVVYVGANNGLIFAATNVTPGQSCCAGFIQLNNVGLPPREVTALAIDPSDPSGKTAYVAFSAFSFVGTDPFGISINDPVGHIFKTTDGGNTWKDVSCSVAVCTTPAAADLPNIPVNDLVIDPAVPGTLYHATPVVHVSAGVVPRRSPHRRHAQISGEGRAYHKQLAYLLRSRRCPNDHSCQPVEHASADQSNHECVYPVDRHRICQ